MSCIVCAVLFSVFVLHAGKEDFSTARPLPRKKNHRSVVDGYLSPEQKTRIESVLLNRSNDEPNKKKVCKRIVVKDMRKTGMVQTCIIYMIWAAPLEVVREFKDYKKLREEFIKQFNSLAVSERIQRMKTGTVFCDETGLMHEAFAHLTDAERNESFKKIDIIDAIIR